MRRRSLLAALAAASSIAGCLGSRTAPDESPTATTPGTTGSTDGTPSCRAAGTRSVTLLGTGSLPGDLDLSMTASIDEPRVTADRPARLAVELTNRGPPREVFPRHGRCHPFNRERGGSDPPGIWAYPTTETPDDRVRGCWTMATARPSSGTPTARAFPSYGCSFASMASGETRSWRYELWDDSLVEGYYPPGRYRFGTVVEVGDSTDESGASSTVPEHEWWLEVRVSRTSD